MKSPDERGGRTVGDPGGGLEITPTQTLSARAREAGKQRMQTAEPWQWRPPDTIDEYQQLEPLGRGGMGRVYLYWDTGLERTVAIKFVSELDDELCELLRQEAKAAAALRHPNVVTIHRVGEVDGVPFIVSEYVAGTSLDMLVPIRPWRRVLELAIDLARGLAEAHKRGVIHGDIKPGNAMLESETGTAKLIDFGLARRASRDRAAGDRTGPSSHARSRAGGPGSSERTRGTPAYAAPELWRGEVATTRSDAYAFGVMLYRLCTGEAPPESRDPANEDGEPTRPPELPADVDPRFATIIGRCMARDPGERYASAEALRAALEKLVRPATLPTGNPYRWLRPFEAEHRALFFGRGSDVWRVLDLLRARHFTLLAGGSGVGKSSLVRAGVLPLLAEDDLGESRSWTASVLTLGAHPVDVLARALAARIGTDEATVREQLGHADLLGIRRQLRERHGTAEGTVLVVDQLEELVTVADDDEATAVGCALASLIAKQTPGFRVLATARLDHVDRLARVPGLGALVDRAVHIVGPLALPAIRETILGPVQAMGVEFESPDMVDTLARAAAQSDGGLPLLQFALAQLWERRDAERQVITRQSLDDIGGVEGALARHADAVLQALVADTRRAARRVLLDLVTREGTRVRREREALEGGDPVQRDALEALIRGRLVVVSKVDGEAVCEIAHEALQSAWPTLRGWVEQATGTRELRERLARDALEWDRLDRADEALWGKKQLGRAGALDPDDVDLREAEFLARSRRAVARARALRWLAFAVPLVAAVAVYGAVRLERAREVDRTISAQLAAAENELAEAREVHAGFRVPRERAVAALAGGDRASAEESWSRALDLEPEIDAAYRRATSALERALDVDPRRDAVRATLARTLDERARFADERHLVHERDDLLGRLSIYGPALHQRWVAPVTVAVGSEPARAVLTVERYVNGPDGRLERRVVRQDARTPAELALEPGSYLLVLAGDATHVEVRYPVRVRPDAAIGVPRRAFSITRPSRADAPEDIRPSRPDALGGFAYVPPGRFLFGYGADAAKEEFRGWFDTVPMHERETGGYWVARHETTYGEWIAFLDECLASDPSATEGPSTPADRCGDEEPWLPAAKDVYSARRVELTALPRGGFGLVVQLDAEHLHTAAHGELLRYTARESDGAFDWRDLPVTGVSAEDVAAYLRWLRVRGSVPGARLCREDEWERAARGADARKFPHGDVLHPRDANFDLSYGRIPGAYGPDAIGAHRDSDSPFGLHDMSGNVWEMTTSVFAAPGPETIVVRGGSFYHNTVSAAVVNRQPFGRDKRDPVIGFRVCSDPIAR